MMKCKYAGDATDEYCKDCNGIHMIVDDKELSCEECAGYEAGEEVIECSSNETDNIEECMNPPEVEEDEKPTNNVKESSHKSKKPEKVDNNTGDDKSLKNDSKNKTTISKNKETKSKDVVKVKEEKKSVEEYAPGGIKVVSMRYTSGATIKKGDNYFKFIAEEEWDVSQIDNVEDAREMLWAKLNAEVDKQIEDLQNL